MDESREISRDLALCMFFYVDFNEENVFDCEKRLYEFGEFEICYNADPLQPVLVSINRIYGDPFTYQCYPKPE